MKDVLSFSFPEEAQLLAFGERLAEAFKAYLAEDSAHSLVVYLNGELGAGKTTLTRRIVQSFGHQGNVKSPTYTLVEEYNIAGKMIYHFDLYRLADPEELEFMGIRDYFNTDCICLIEWSEKGQGILPEADFLVNIDYYDDARNIELVAQTELGENIIQAFSH